MGQWEQLCEPLGRHGHALEGKHEPAQEQVGQQDKPGKCGACLCDIVPDERNRIYYVASGWGRSNYGPQICFRCRREFSGWTRPSVATAGKVVADHFHDTSESFGGCGFDPKAAYVGEGLKQTTCEGCRYRQKNRCL